MKPRSLRKMRRYNLKYKRCNQYINNIPNISLKIMFPQFSSFKSRNTHLKNEVYVYRGASLLLLSNFNMQNKSKLSILQKVIICFYEVDHTLSFDHLPIYSKMSTVFLYHVTFLSEKSKKY